MKATFKLKRRLIILLTALLFLCCGFLAFNYIGNKKEASASQQAVGRDALLLYSNQGTDLNAYWICNDGSGGYLTKSDYGITLNFRIQPTVAFGDSTEYYLDAAFFPGFEYNTIFGPGTFEKASGHFFMRFKINYGEGAGLAVQFFSDSKEGSYVESGNYSLGDGIWSKTSSTQEAFNVCIRIIKVNGNWDIIVNGLSFNDALGSSTAFADYLLSYTAENVFWGALNFALMVRDHSLPANVYSGTIRSATAADCENVSKTNDYMRAYTSATNSYYDKNSDYMAIGNKGAWVAFDTYLLAAPYSSASYNTSFCISFSPDTSLAYQDNDSGLSTSGDKASGRFYFKFRYYAPDESDTPTLQVSPRFYQGQEDSWTTLKTTEGGENVSLQFFIKQGSGGWRLFLFCDGSLMATYTAGLQAYVNQAMILNSSYGLNVGVAGNFYYGHCNYAEVYYSGYSPDTRGSQAQETSGIGEVLYNSPKYQFSYYDDYGDTSGYIGVSADTAFDVNLNVTLKETLGDTPKSFKLAFGNNSTVPDINVAPTSEITQNHFVVAFILNKNGSSVDIYAHIYYAENGAWPTIGEDYADFWVASFSNAVNSSVDLAISLHRVNAATDPVTSYGFYVNEILVDSLKFNQVIYRAAAAGGTGFMETANKNVAVITDATSGGNYGLSSLPADVCVKSIQAHSYVSYSTPTAASVADLKSGGTELFTDTLNVTTSAKNYYWNATSDTNSNNVTFKFKFTYNPSNELYFYFRTPLAAKTGFNECGYFFITSSGIILGAYHSSSGTGAFWRENPLASGAEYEVWLTETSVGSTTTTLLAICILDTDGNVVHSQEAQYITGTGNSGMNIGTYRFSVYLNKGSSVALNGVIHRTKFVEDDGTVIATDRKAHGAAGISEPTESGKSVTLSTGRTYDYDFYGWVNGDDVYSGMQAINETKVYTAKYTFGAKGQIISQINGQNTKYEQTARIFATGTTTTSTGGVAFINGVDKTLFDDLSAACSAGYISDYQTGTIISTTAVTESTLKVGCTGWKIANDIGSYYATEENVNYISAAIINIPFSERTTLLYGRAYIKIVNTDGTVVYFYGDIQNMNLQQAAAKAVGDDASLYSAQQKAIFKTFTEEDDADLYQGGAYGARFDFKIKLNSDIADGDLGNIVDLSFGPDKNVLTREGGGAKGHFLLSLVPHYNAEKSAYRMFMHLYDKDGNELYGDFDAAELSTSQYFEFSISIWKDSEGLWNLCLTVGDTTVTDGSIFPKAIGEGIFNSNDKINLSFLYYGDAESKVDIACTAVAALNSPHLVVPKSAIGGVMYGEETLWDYYTDYDEEDPALLTAGKYGATFEFGVKPEDDIAKINSGEYVYLYVGPDSDYDGTSAGHVYLRLMPSASDGKLYLRLFSGNGDDLYGKDIYVGKLSKDAYLKFKVSFVQGTDGNWYFILKSDEADEKETTVFGARVGSDFMNAEFKTDVAIKKAASVPMDAVLWRAISQTAQINVEGDITVVAEKTNYINSMDISAYTGNSDYGTTVDTLKSMTNDRYSAQTSAITDATYYSAQYKKSLTSSWTNAKAYAVAVNNINESIYDGFTGTTDPHTVVYLDVSSDLIKKGVTVRLYCNYSDVSSAVVKTATTSENATVSINRYMTFTAKEYGSYTVLPSCSGYEEYQRPVTVFIREPESLTLPDGYTLIKYEAGVHRLDVTELVRVFGDNTVLYLEAGAVLVPEYSKGYPVLVGTDAKVKNVKVMGHGIIDQSRLDKTTGAAECMYFTDITNLEINGITFLNSSSWTMEVNNSDNVTIKDVIIFGYRVNSDGICIDGSRDVLVENCFVRSGDDLFEIKTIVSAADNVTFNNCVGWADKCRGYGIIQETCYSATNITYSDCALLFQLSSWTGGATTDNSTYMAGWAIVAAERGSVSDVTFDNCSIYKTMAYAIHISAGRNHETGTETVNNTVKNVTFKNCSFNMGKLDEERASYRPGYIRFYNGNENNEAAISGITFDNLTMNGVAVTSVSQLRAVSAYYANATRDVYSYVTVK